MARVRTCKYGRSRHLFSWDQKPLTARKNQKQKRIQESLFQSVRSGQAKYGYHISRKTKWGKCDELPSFGAFVFVFAFGLAGAAKERSAAEKGIGTPGAVRNAVNGVRRAARRSICCVRCLALGGCVGDMHVRTTKKNVHM